MELTVNGKPLVIDLEKQRTFGEVMTSLYGAVVDDSTVVTKIVVNGEIISEEREKALAPLPKDDITVIEIYTRHPLELADEAMKSGLEYLGKLMEALRRNAKSFRLRDSLPVDDFQSCVDGLHWFFQLINALKGPLHIAGTEEVTEGKTFRQAEMEAITAIHELCDAREKNETVGIADALEYELLPNLENWRQWLVKKTDPGVAFRELERKTTPKSG